MRSIQRATTLVIGALVLAACGSAPSGSPARLQGDALDPGAKPDAALCAQRLRTEVAAAVRIRETFGKGGLETTEEAAQEAAADPASNVELIGIPLRPAEVEALGLIGGPSPFFDRVEVWVHQGAPERFGGIWFDPPGSQEVVVSIVASEPATLQLARCIETPGTRFVHAELSFAQLGQLTERIAADGNALRATGIQLAGVSQLENLGLVQVGVTGATQEIARALLERYGPHIRVVEEQAGEKG